MPQGSHLNPEQRGHDQFLFLIEKVCVGQLLSDKAVIDLFDAFRSRRINEDGVEGIQKIVARCSAYRPFSREPLRPSQNFLYEDEELAGILGSRIFAKLFAQAIHVSERIPQSVDVIDTQAIDWRLRSQARDQTVCGFEDQRILDTHANEICDREKSTVINLFIHVLPVGQDIELLGKQPLQRRETSGIASLSEKFVHAITQKCVHLRICIYQLSQSLPQSFETQTLLTGFSRFHRCRRWQCGKRRDDSRIFLICGGFFSKCFPEFVDVLAENSGIRSWCKREQ